MKKMIIAGIAAAGMLFSQIPAGAVLAADGQGTVKDVYIDNTVDNSQSTVIGQVIVTDKETGEQTTEQVYSSSAGVTYSNPRPDAVNSMIADAQAACSAYASDNGYTVTSDFTVDEAVGTVWDNRKYTTVEDGDAVLIGDSDYLTGAYGINENYTITHIAEGDYGKNTTYTVTLNAEKAAAVPAEDTPAETVTPPANTDTSPGTSAPAASTTSQTKTQTKVQTGKKSPATGSTENRGLMVMLCAISLGAFGVVFTRGRKKSR